MISGSRFGRWLVGGVAAATAIMVVPPVFAQQPPGAEPPGADFFQERLQQELERREERQREGRRPSDEPVLIGPDPAGEGDLPETEDVFELEAIEFSESAFLDEEVLRDIADAYAGIPVDFAALNRMIGEVNALYADRGILTGRAMIPPQRVDDGILQVQLVEGRLGALEMDGQQRLREPFILNRIASMEPGEVVDVIALQESIAWLNRTQDFRVAAALRAGSEPGETDVLLRVQEPPRYTAQLFTDNHGSESTGEYRVGANLAMYSPLGFGDRLSLLLLGTEGSDNISLGYQFPVNRRGGQLELRYTEGSIDIVEGPFRDLDVEGDSRVTALTFSQPLMRRDTRWLDLTLRASRTESETKIQGLPLSDFTTDRANAGLRLTGFGDRSQWTVRQGVQYARLENIQNESDTFWFLEGIGSYNTAFFDNALMTVRGGYQWTHDDAVPSPLLYQVGGPASVRGYEEGAAGGASGYFLNLESRYLGFNRVSPFAFIDHGYVSDVSPSSETLISGGFGLGWEGPDWVTAEVMLGVPFRDVEPDQDSYRVEATISLSWSGG